MLWSSRALSNINTTSAKGTAANRANASDANSGAIGHKRLQRECFEWGISFHALLALTPTGWNALADFHLWPQGMRPPIEPLVPLWSDESETASCQGEDSRRTGSLLNIVGIERLSGILTAAINVRRGAGWSDCLQLGREPLVVKDHGSSYRINTSAPLDWKARDRVPGG